MGQETPPATSSGSDIRPPVVVYEPFRANPNVLLPVAGLDHGPAATHATESSTLLHPLEVTRDFGTPPVAPLSSGELPPPPVTQLTTHFDKQSRGSDPDLQHYNQREKLIYQRLAEREPDNPHFLHIEHIDPDHLVMEKLRGENLIDVQLGPDSGTVGHDPVPAKYLPAALQLLADAKEALQDFHRIIGPHGDYKIVNLNLREPYNSTRKNDLVLLDPSLARDKNEPALGASVPTETSDIYGTMPYVHPDRLRAVPEEWTPGQKNAWYEKIFSVAGDSYSFMILCFDVVFGRIPQASNDEKFEYHHIAHLKPLDPETIRTVFGQLDQTQLIEISDKLYTFFQPLVESLNLTTYPYKNLDAFWHDFTQLLTECQAIAQGSDTLLQALKQSGLRTGFETNQMSQPALPARGRLLGKVGQFLRANPKNATSAGD